MRNPMERVKNFFKIKENIYYKEGPTGLENSENQRHLSINIKDFSLRKGIVVVSVTTLAVVGLMNAKANINKEKEEYNNAVLVGQLSVNRQNLQSGINPPNLEDMATRIKQNDLLDNPVKSSLNPEDLGQKDRLARAISGATRAFNKALNEKGIELPKELDANKVKDNVNFEGQPRMIDRGEEERLEALRKRLGMMKR